MKEIEYRKRQSIRHRRKVVSINERTQDKDCSTHVRKSFAYVVTLVPNAQEPVPAPEVFINKVFASKKKEEKFSFKVKGAFYMEKQRCTLRVDFCHTLKIDIVWKNKIFSPKKSATLT